MSRRIPRWRTRLARHSVFALVLAMAFAACSEPVARSTFPPLGSSPGPAGDATAGTRALVIRALADAGFEAADSARPYRPPEGPLLAAAPRSILQARLANDADHGFIAVYALPSPADALAAAEDHAAYLSSGTGGGSLVPPGTRFVVRVVGSTVVLFSWLPANSPDPRTSDIARVLETIGTGVAVPG